MVWVLALVHRTGSCSWTRYSTLTVPPFAPRVQMEIDDVKAEDDLAMAVQSIKVKEGGGVENCLITFYDVAT